MLFIKQFYLKYILFAFASYVLLGCVAAPVKIDMAATPAHDEKDSSTFEQRLGEAGYYFMMLNFKFVDDAKTVNRLSRIGARISHYTERPNIKYKYFILDSKYRNAFAIPDGYVFLTSSLITTLKDDDKIAAVIAHEIAHITHKHQLENYERKKGSNPLRAIIGRDVFNSATEIGYSMAHEFQADQTSLRYLYRSGFDPKAVISSLDDLKHIEAEDAAEYEKDRKNQPQKESDSKFLAVHPYTKNRIVNAINYLDEVYKTEKNQYNPQDFNF